MIVCFDCLRTTALLNLVCKCSISFPPGVVEHAPPTTCCGEDPGGWEHCHCHCQHCHCHCQKCHCPCQNCHCIVIVIVLVIALSLSALSLSALSLSAFSLSALSWSTLSLSALALSALSLSWSSWGASHMWCHSSAHTTLTLKSSQKYLDQIFTIQNLQFQANWPTLIL